MKLLRSGRLTPQVQLPRWSLFFLSPCHYVLHACSLLRFGFYLRIPENVSFSSFPFLFSQEILLSSTSVARSPCKLGVRQISVFPPQPPLFRYHLQKIVMLIRFRMKFNVYLLRFIAWNKKVKSNFPKINFVTKKCHFWVCWNLISETQLQKAIEKFGFSGPRHSVT